MQCDENIKMIQKSWNETNKENEKIYKVNGATRAKVLKQIEEFCYDLGYPTYVHGHGGEVIGEHAEFKAMGKQLDMRMPHDVTPHRMVAVGIRSAGEVIKPATPCSTLIEFVHEMRPIIEQQEQKKLDHALAIAQAKATSVKEFATVAEKIKARLAMRKLNEKDKARWLASNYPINSPVAIDCCDDCDTWLFGHKTCKCGRHYIEYRVVGEVGKWELKHYTNYAPIRPLIPDFSDILAVKHHY